MKNIKAVLGAGLIVLGLGLFSKAQAAPDTMVLTVTPSGSSYGVSIASPEVQGYDFSSVGIGNTTVSTRAIAVSNTGNTAEFLTMGVVDTTGGGNAWINSTSNAFKTYVMQGLISAGQPANASFAVGTNNVAAAPAGTGASTYGQGASPAVNPGTPSNVWLQLQMPSGVAETGVHTLVLSINGQST